MHTLYHYSEEPDIQRFEPRHYPNKPDEGPIVWALHSDSEPLYLFPRDCPRVAFWALPESTPEDIERFLGVTEARIVQTIESCWLERLRATTLYRYTMPSEAFRPESGSGFYGAYLAQETVEPLAVEAISDLLAAHVASGSELRVTPSLWPLWDRIVPSSLHFSGVRLRNAQPRVEKQNL